MADNRRTNQEKKDEAEFWTDLIPTILVALMLTAVLAALWAIGF